MENSSLPAIVKGMMKMSRTVEENNMVMTSAQIRQGAQDNGLSYPAYISGVMSGTYKSVPQINMERIREATTKMREENERYRAENRRIEMERQQRQRESSMNSYKRQMEYIASKPAPKYSGGPGPSSTGSCCGNCRYYMVHDNKCAYSKYRYPTGASDYCSDYISK
ncbi:MAG: hypothetical protein NC395_05255 [Prevotella sp.]|nr:hypothetical protein [Prevotella sp.]